MLVARAHSRRPESPQVAPLVSGVSAAPSDQGLEVEDRVTDASADARWPWIEPVDASRGHRNIGGEVRRTGSGGTRRAARWVEGVSAMTSASFPCGWRVDPDPDCVMCGGAAFQHHMYASFGVC